VRRATCGQLTSAMATTTVRIEGSRMATSKMHSMKAGMVWNSSVKRISHSPTRPPT